MDAEPPPPAARDRSSPARASPSSRPTCCCPPTSARAPSALDRARRPRSRRSCSCCSLGRGAEGAALGRRQGRAVVTPGPWTRSRSSRAGSRWRAACWSCCSPIPYTRRMDRGHGEFYAAAAVRAARRDARLGRLRPACRCSSALELVTISSYVLAAFRRNDPSSTEAGLKYLVVGSVSSAMLLFGIAFVYGAVGRARPSTRSPRTSRRGFATRCSSLGAGLAARRASSSRRRPSPSRCGLPTSTRARPRPVTAFLSSRVEERGDRAAAAARAASSSSPRRATAGVAVWTRSSASSRS